MTMPNAPEPDVLAPAPVSIVAIAIAAERGMVVSLSATDWEAIAYYLRAYNALAALLLEWEADATHVLRTENVGDPEMLRVRDRVAKARARLTAIRGTQDAVEYTLGGVWLQRTPDGVLSVHDGHAYRKLTAKELADLKALAKDLP